MRNALPRGGAFFVGKMQYFYVQNAKKCKKMQKKCKKLQKNLHISKIYCNFAPSFEKEMTRTPKRNPKTKQK